MLFRAPLLLMSASAFHAGGRRAALLARGGSNTRLFSKGTSADDAAAIDALISKFSVSKDGTFITENALDTFHFIRPSGNPLSKAEYPAFVDPSGDVVVKEHENVSVNTLDICGDMAFASLTQKAKFEYKGAPNDDVYVATLVFKKVGGEWKVAWAQRSSGDATPVFNGL